MTIVWLAACLLAAQEKASDFLYVQAGEAQKWFAVDGRTGALTAKGALATPGRAASYLRPSSDGRIPLQPGPGLGVEVNEKRIEELAAQPQKYRWPGSKLGDGSVVDY